MRKSFQERNLDRSGRAGLLVTCLALACGNTGGGGEATGGTPGSGGGVGGTSATGLGGTDQQTSNANSGGMLATGGLTATGGVSNAGSGGSSLNTGGALSTGGSLATGGVSGGGAQAGSTGGRLASGGISAMGGSLPTGGVTVTGGATMAASGGRPSSAGGGAADAGATGKGGTLATGGAAGSMSSTGGATGGASAATGGTTSPTGGLPALHVDGKFIKDSSGKTVVLRGYALIDIGALYLQTNSATGITKRIDAIAAAGLQGHVVRMPVYPRTDFNGSDPYYSGLPYPVGSAAPAGQKVTVMTGPDYISKVLKPAIDYATAKNMYAIIDLHQIDDTTASGSKDSGAATTSFWTDIAPVFKDSTNVIYELFNEPINGGMPWATFKTQVQGWIDTVRAAAPSNLIIVPSMSWDQHPGDAASSPPQGTNLVYTAHIYPNNWGASFQAQLTTAVAKAPVFITEWGYSPPQTTANWGTPFETVVDTSGASWTAWVTDNSWGPSMFSNAGLTTLTDFGTLVKNWLAAKVAQDWVE